jgi:hypothetical protein
VGSLLLIHLFCHLHSPITPLPPVEAQPVSAEQGCTQASERESVSTATPEHAIITPHSARRALRACTATLLHSRRSSAHLRVALDHLPRRPEGAFPLLAPDRPEVLLQRASAVGPQVDDVGCRQRHRLPPTRAFPLLIVVSRVEQYIACSYPVPCSGPTRRVSLPRSESPAAVRTRNRTITETRAVQAAQQ